MRPPQIAARFLLTIVLLSALPAAVLLPTSRVVAQSTVSDPRKIQADRLSKQGQQLLDAGRVKESISAFESALKLYRSIGDRAEEGAVLGILGHAYDSLEQFAKALAFHQQAAE
ncbi:MAG: tetratricopeptide repeat protein, partial [Phormidesmis sp. CAN_BIN44]|nr:tetratricopeptide repeat protein [Phormidesmis sp. CAN_BIN44]